MANREIVKVPIDSEYILERMKEDGISLRKLGEDIDGWSDRSIRAYLKAGEMPPGLLNEICQRVSMCASKAIRGKTIWMRLGVIVPVTDEEYAVLAETDDGDVIGISDGVAASFLKRAIVDGGQLHSGLRV